MILKFRKSLKSGSGVTMLEFSVLATLLIPLLFITLQLFLLSFNSLSLQFVTTWAMRQAVLGPAEGMTWEEHILAVENNAIAYASGFGITLEPESIEICPVKRGCSPGQPPVPEELIYIKATKDVSIFLIGQKTASGLALGRNEP